MQSFYQQLEEQLHQGPVVLATIVDTVGSAPREIGAKMAICPDGTIIGTVGGGAGEGKVIQQALPLFQSEHSQLVAIDLSGAVGRDIQGVCGGKVQIWLQKWSGQQAIALVEQVLQLFANGERGTLTTPVQDAGFPYLLVNNQETQQDDAQLAGDHFIEPIEPPPTLLIVGAGHIGMALAKVADWSGFQVAVQDDRPEYVTPARFPNALLFSTAITTALEQLLDPAQVYIALVARGYQQDLVALRAILKSTRSYDYVGAIGSQKRIQMLRRSLQQQALPIENLNPFHAPIGLDIGALTPQEIAVSICAELIKVRRGGTGVSLSQRIQTISSNSFSPIDKTRPKVHLSQH